MEGYQTSRGGSRTEFYEGGFVGVLANRQSYLNIVYLLISFPLGIFYFLFLVIGLSLGLGLAILGIGLIILLAMLAASHGLAAWERLLSGWMLGTDIIAPRRRAEPWNHPLAALRKYLTDAYTWKSLAYLLVKFPFGILSFVVTVVLFSFTISLILAPLIYQFVPVTVIDWHVTRADQALLCLASGLVLGLLSVHLVNLLAGAWRAFARWMLSGPREEVPRESRGPIIIP